MIPMPSVTDSLVGYLLAAVFALLWGGLGSGLLVAGFLNWWRRNAP